MSDADSAADGGGPLADPGQELEEPIKSAVDAWDALGWPRPQVAVVAGSGLAVELTEPGGSGFETASGDDSAAASGRGPLDLSYFLPFAAHPLAGHPHQVELLASRPGRRAVYFRGRLHAYQGYSAHQVAFPVRLAARLGARVLVLTNASGGLRSARRAGELTLVRDHLNLTGDNPLRGQLPPAWGPRFPDLVDAYDPRLRALASRLAAEQGVDLPEVVYAGLLGPSYETPAEVAMLRALGADVAGMSTVFEVIAARQMGLACLCLSLVANPAAGLAAAPLAHEDVLAAAAGGAARLRRLLLALLASDELLDSAPAGG